MEVFLNSFLIVFISEMGDKTQLLALVLASRYRKPWVVLCGILVATLLNHGLAAWGGLWLASLVSPATLRYLLALSFFIFGIWILFPDKEEEVADSKSFGIFLTTVSVFFIAEIGDKTQLATVALGARYASLWWVTLGTTAGMIGSNALAIFFGQQLLRRVPMKWVHRAASVLFILFGIAILWS